MNSIVRRTALKTRYIRRCLATDAHNSSSSSAASRAYLASETPTTPYNLTPGERETLARVIRVDQAGEVAANWIYMGQLAVLGKDKSVGPVIQGMWDQEKKHLVVMNKLQEQHRIRPTALLDLAKVAGFSLGAVTALMGKEAAMACTEAVETVIGEHYNDQLKDLDALPTSHQSIPVLKDLIRELRDDELEHLDTAIDFHSQRAPAHALLSAIIEAGCGVAIQVCKRI